MPIVAQSWSKPRSILKQAENADARAARRRSGGSPVANLLIVVLIALPVLLVQPWMKHTLPLPQPYQDMFTDVPGGPQLFSKGTPVDATEYLLQSPCEGNLFNEMGYGSYMTWAYYPAGQIFIDPRVELYPLEQWEDYAAMTRGQQVGSLLDKYAIDCAMIDVHYQQQMAEVMPNLPGWQRTYQDDETEIWRRTQ
ncbi:MAG: hypothetical protein HC837_06940 [Chloroflexaceae bacterium]|nr:hypothetical protein [Chloroflexaceae bacterium]